MEIRPERMKDQCGDVSSHAAPNTSDTYPTIGEGLPETLQSHVQYIAAALSYYDGSPCSPDVRDAWGFIVGALRELEADRAALTKALTGLTCGGSEFFVRRGESFVADIPACLAYLQKVRAGQHAVLRGAIAAKKAAQAELAALPDPQRSQGATDASQSPGMDQ